MAGITIKTIKITIHLIIIFMFFSVFAVIIECDPAQNKTEDAEDEGVGKIGLARESQYQHRHGETAEYRCPEVNRGGAIFGVEKGFNKF